MAYSMNHGYYEQDKVCYSEQEGYGRSGYGMPRHHHNHNHNHNQVAGWTDKVTECESYSAAGYNHGGYATPTLANQGYGCYGRKEEMCKSQSHNGGFHRRGTGYHRRRVMRRTVSRGEYSSSESDSD